MISKCEWHDYAGYLQVDCMFMVKAGQKNFSDTFIQIGTVHHR